MDNNSVKLYFRDTTIVAGLDTVFGYLNIFYHAGAFVVFLALRNISGLVVTKPQSSIFLSDL